MSQSPSISVVVPVKNGAAHIGRQLKALSLETCKWPWEIIVSDNGSTDGTRALCEELTGPNVGLRVIDASGRPGANHARNRGFQESTATHVLFCDSDDQVEKGWLAGMQAAFEEGHEIIAGGLRLIYAKGEAPLLPGRAEMYGFLPWAGSANLGVSRDLLERIGGFDETYRGGAEEIELLWRTQIQTDAQVVSVPRAIVSKYQRTTALQTLTQQRRYQRAAYRLWNEFGPYGMPRPHVLDDIFTVANGNLTDRLVPWRVATAEVLGRLIGNVEGELFLHHEHGRSARESGGAGLC